MNSTLSYKDYMASVEVSEEDGCFHGRIEFIDDLVTFEADNYQELVQSFHAAVEDYLETCKSVGKDPDKSFKGTFNVRIGPELHKRAAVAARKADQTLNEFVKDAVEKNLGKGSVVHHEHHHKVEMTTSSILPLSGIQKPQWITPAYQYQTHGNAGTRRLRRR